MNVHISERKVAAIRGISLFLNFFQIIFAYYMIKPASRSIYLEHFRADQLPYVWIASALLLGLLMPAYCHFVDRHDRRKVVMFSCQFFCAILLIFVALLQSGKTSPAVAVGFYILVDILSVVLVEQFWSLTNSNYATHTGSRWYGFVGSGGLVGGILGGMAASWLIRETAMTSYDLMLLSAFLLFTLGVYAELLINLDIYSEESFHIRPQGLGNSLSFTRIFSNRYILLITITILLAQLVEPIVEYQFLSFVEQVYTEREARTAYLSTFLSVLGMVALTINLLLTPLVLRYLGAIGGMLFQPVILLMASGYFNSSPGLSSGAAMKISDRGLSYSLNRASKEMLYVPVDPTLIYRAKAWIDMFGYRMFKIIGAVLVLALTQWFSFNWSSETFSYLVMPVCLVWILVVISLKPDYQRLRRHEQTVVQSAMLT
jgi:AAA family ATP:ADP antiporter